MRHDPPRPTSEDSLTWLWTTRQLALLWHLHLLLAGLGGRQFTSRSRSTLSGACTTESRLSSQPHCLVPCLRLRVMHHQRQIPLLRYGQVPIGFRTTWCGTGGLISEETGFSRHAGCRHGQRKGAALKPAEAIVRSNRVIPPGPQPGARGSSPREIFLGESLSGVDRRGEFGGRVFLHRRQHVRIGVEGQDHGGVAQPLGDHLRVDPCQQHEGRARVAKVIHADRLWHHAISGDPPPHPARLLLELFGDLGQRLTSLSHLPGVRLELVQPVEHGPRAAVGEVAPLEGQTQWAREHEPVRRAVWEVDELRQAARTWDEHGRSSDYLWTGAAYREYASWRERYAGALTEIEQAFADAMAAHAARRRRFGRTLLVSLLLVVGAPEFDTSGLRAPVSVHSFGTPYTNVGEVPSTGNGP